MLVVATGRGRVEGLEDMVEDKGYLLELAPGLTLSKVIPCGKSALCLSRDTHGPPFVVSKHILNAQVTIRAPCCKRWFDCAECHAEQSDHRLTKTNEMTFLCKKCKKAFRKDMSVYEESDEYCPHCDNHYVQF